MKKRNYFRLLILCPLLLGGIGFWAVDHLRVQDAFFYTLQMYFLNYGEPPTNIWVELARWTAPVATATTIIMVLTFMSRYCNAWFRTLITDSVAVYGPEKEAEQIIEQLGFRGIRGDKDKLLPADRYILLGKQEDNFAFYESHQKKLQKAEVYLQCDTLPAQSVSPINVHLFQPMEIAARLFWKKGDLLITAGKKDYILNIAYIGFGRIGEELLYWGLLNNVFSPGQKITYHIFGDISDFTGSHPMLNEITDPIIQYDDGWQNHLSVLADADLILVLPQEEETSQKEVTSRKKEIPLETVVYQLLSLVPEKKLTIFTSEPVIISMLDEQDRLQIINISPRALQISNILENDLIESAMKVNLRYAHIYNHVEETPDNSRTEWKKLNTFLRYSNISAADYHEIRLMMLQQMGVQKNGSDLTDEQRELLAELEHIRWCRFHWLNNWRYGKPENGKTKDPDRRIHADLLPYYDLPKEERKKDRETIEVMLGL